MPSPKKPKALYPGARVRIIAPASPAPAEAVEKGITELRRLGYQAEFATQESRCDGYFSAPARTRAKEFLDALADRDVSALIAARGGYGSNYLIPELRRTNSPRPKVFVGFSDTTTLSCFLWKKSRWVTFYGPMAAAGFDGGANAPNGYDSDSFTRAVTETRGGWILDLHGETLSAGKARGTLLGGCLTLLQTSIGTPWEMDTRGAILAIEDRGVRPYQVDRMLMHLLQAGKFRGVRGVVIGDFPECEPKNGEGPSVRDVCARILAPLKIPLVFGAPIGHTRRPMLTLPLGIRARLTARGSGALEFLEPAVHV